MRSLVLISALAFSLPAAARAQQFGLWTKSRELLKLVRHDVEVFIQHPVAETTVTQEFENPHAFSLEAFFYYPVPAGATVTGMALWVNGVRREARMLERQQAREIYQGIVNEKRDPALLERLDGNTFRIRIFPVLARSRQRVELRFVQPVEQEGPGRYSYTLRRPPGEPIFSLGLGVRLRALESPLKRVALTGYRGQFTLEGDVYTLPMAHAKRSFKEDIHLRYQLHQPLKTPAVVTFDSEGRRLFFAELPLEPGRRPPPKTAVLVDTSLSMAPHLARARALAEKLVTQTRARAQVAVAPFDILARGPLKFDQAGGEGLSLLSELEGHGGTAYVPAFREALAAGAQHIICITDGGTLLHQEELEYLLRLIHDRPHAMVSIIATDRAINEQILVDLTAISGGLFQKLGAEGDANALARGLMGRQGKSGGALQGPGEVRSIRREPHRQLVAGAVPRFGSASEARELTLDDTTHMLDLSSDAPQVPGAGGLWAAAEIEHQMRLIRIKGESEEYRAAVVQLSMSHNVLSEYTALLATETDADYKRPTSGRKWQRQPGHRLADQLPQTDFHSTPEPHEIALCALAALMLLVARRRKRSDAGIPGGPAAG